MAFVGTFFGQAFGKARKAVGTGLSDAGVVDQASRCSVLCAAFIAGALPGLEDDVAVFYDVLVGYAHTVPVTGEDVTDTQFRIAFGIAQVRAFTAASVRTTFFPGTIGDTAKPIHAHFVLCTVRWTGGGRHTGLGLEIAREISTLAWAQSTATVRTTQLAGANGLTAFGNGQRITPMDIAVIGPAIDNHEIGGIGSECDIDDFQLIVSEFIVRSDAGTDNVIAVADQI